MVNAQKAIKADLKAGFLAHLAKRGLLISLVKLQKPAYKPPFPVVAPPLKQDLSIPFDYAPAQFSIIF